MEDIQKNPSKSFRYFLITSIFNSDGTVTFNKNGITNFTSLTEAFKQEFEGYFAFYRMSGLLPIEYKF